MIYKVPLMRNAFYKEKETIDTLIEFLKTYPRLSMGEKCKQFEQEFAKKMGRKHGVLVNSGASANLILLQALVNTGAIEKGDKIAFSAVTWSTNVFPIINIGCTPVPVDVNPRTMNVMLEDLKKVHKAEKVRVFFATHILGATGDLPEIQEYCNANHILFVSDSCETLGTDLHTGPSSQYSLASSYSFFVSHILSSVEGGIVLTDNDILNDHLIICRANGWSRNLSVESRAELHREYGIESDWDASYKFFEVGFNVRPTEAVGVLGLKQLTYLDEIVEKRQSNYNYITEVMQENPDFFKLKLPHIKTFCSFCVPVIAKTPELRSQYLEKLHEAGVETRPFIAGDITQQPFFLKYSDTLYNLPGAQTIDKNAFYCGLYPDMTKEDMDIIRDCLKKT